MSNTFLQQLSNETILLNNEVITFYQLLKESEKKEFLNILKNKDLDRLISYERDFCLKVSIFFCKESIKLAPENFKIKKFFNDIMYNIIYRISSNSEEDIKIKKEIIDELIEKKIFSIETKIYNSPITHLAAVNNSLKFIEYLICLGAKISTVDKDGDTFASSCLYSHENIEVFKFAISQPSFKPHKGTNILSIAIEKEYNKIIEIILDTDLLENQSFLEKVMNDFPEEMEKEIMPRYEKKLLERNILLEINPKNKIKI